MIFKDIKIQSTVQILDPKTLAHYTGKVTDIKPSKVNSSVPGGFMLDFTVEYNGVIQVFSIPDHLKVTYAGNNLILSVDKANLLPELDKIIYDGEQTLNNIDSIKSGIEKAKNLKMEWDPSFKEKQQTEERLSRLESSITDIKDMLSKLLK